MRRLAMYSRRGYCTRAPNQSTLIALAPTVPGFLAETARAAPPGRDDRALVVIELNPEAGSVRRSAFR